MLIVDSHLDLAHNAVNLNRDITQPLADLRRLEAGMSEPFRGRGTVSLPSMRAGQVGLCFATVIARVSDKWREAGPLDASAQHIAYARAQGQLAYYRLLESDGELRQIRSRAQLDAHVEQWTSGDTQAPLGFVLAMEGADPIVAPEQVQAWWDDGLRVISLSHYGVSSYAHGTHTDGGLLDRGPALLHAMQEVGLTLDLTHLADQAFWEALDHFDGAVLASHNNCRALVPDQRQLSDDMLRAIIQRDGVIGTAFDAWMLHDRWVIGESSSELVSLANVVDHLDHVCQVAGNADHAALGTDLDGGFGREQSPRDLDTIADLQKIPALLTDRGYAEPDIRKLMHGNWIRFLTRTLPA